MLVEIEMPQLASRPMTLDEHAKIAPNYPRERCSIQVDTSGRPVAWGFYLYSPEQEAAWFAESRAQRS